MCWRPIRAVTNAIGGRLREAGRRSQTKKEPVHMDLSHWIWLAAGAYGVHAFEEFELDWRNWARAVIGLPVEWHDFYVVNFLVIVLGIVAAELAHAAPGLAL